MKRVLPWWALCLWMAITFLTVVSGKAQFMPGPRAWAPAAGPINPATVPGLAMWYDPADGTTLWQDQACSTAAATGDAIYCVKDKGPNHCDMTRATGAGGPILTVVTSGTKAFLAFTGVEVLHSTCLSVLQNVPRSILFFAGSVTTATQTANALFYANTNASTVARLAGGYGISGAPAWGIRARRLDADSGVNIGSATQTTAITEVHSVIEYTLATNNGTVVINPGASTFTGTIGDGVTSGSNTSNTPSLTSGVNLGADDTVGTAFIGNVYQMLLYTPTSSMSAGTIAQLDTFVCARAGLVC